jgi:hypothetical protein
MSKFIFRRLHLLYLLYKDHLRSFFWLFLWFFLSFFNGLFVDYLGWWLFLDIFSLFCYFFHFPPCVLIESVSDAVLDDINEFFDVEYEEGGDGFGAVLLLDIVVDVDLKVGEEIVIGSIAAEVEYFADGLLHLLDIESLQRLALDAFDVELVVDLLFDVTAVGLKIDLQALPRLLDLVHLLLQNINQLPSDHKIKIEGG